VGLSYLQVGLMPPLTSAVTKVTEKCLDVTSRCHNADNLFSEIEPKLRHNFPAYLSLLRLTQNPTILLQPWLPPLPPQRPSKANLAMQSYPAIAICPYVDIMLGDFHYSVRYSNGAPPLLLAVSLLNANGHQHCDRGKLRERGRKWWRRHHPEVAHNRL
jgi:hypothetical protein